MPQWQKPENALRRANELLEVGKKQDALDTLHDVIKARKHRTWTKVHEQIMTKHLELCVELRKPHLAKDGLFQYRNVCQQVNVKSLEDVMTFFLEQAERKADEARQASQGLVEDVAEDLDQAESPERLLLSAVSGEGAQDRADRSVLSPWLRFLWESYRQCLELLRNNAQVEQLYHKVAKQAFQFCLTYQRRAEFRKLCDNLRTHVNQLQKSHVHYGVKLSNAETLALHQETRLTQLDVAIQMELWQEAYRSAEDVHQLMQSAKRSAKAQTLASYYERLALIFWKAGNTLYHTAALFNLFQLHKDLKKSFSSDEATHLATRVLLATLSISWGDQVHDLARHLEMEEAHVEHQRRLAGLLGWPTPPTRQFLLKELQRVNVIGMALPPAQQLFQWLECEFCPLKMSPEIQRLLDEVKECNKNEYSQYMEALQQVAALKVLKQISQVYRSISLQRFLAMVPFFDMFRLERLIVAAGKKARMQVRIDHRSGSVEFGAGEALTFSSEGDDSVGVTQLDVPVIQSMPSEHIRHYLQQMYVVLQEAVESVDKEAAESMLEKLKYNAKYYDYHKVDHHSKTLQRKKCIEAYKETLEKIKTEQEEIAKQQEKRELEKRQHEDQQRLLQEKQERTEAQRRREQEEMTRRVMQDRIDRMKDPNLRRLIKDLPEEEIQNLDAETLLQKQISHMEQEKREQLAKMKQQEKKWDYYVRAIHQEEIPLREAEHKERAVIDRQIWEQHEMERVEREEEEHIAKVSNHNRLSRVETDAMTYLKTVRDARAAEMKRRMEEWIRTLEETKQKRLQERKDERKEKRRQEWLQARELEKMKKEEEERKKKEADELAKRGGDRRPFDQGRRTRDADDSGEPRGADADTWQRMGPIQPEPGRRAPTRPQERADEEDQEQWRRMGPQEPPPAPVRGEQGGYGGEPGLEDGGRRYNAPAPADAESWQRVGPQTVEPVRKPAWERAPERAEDEQPWRRQGPEGPPPPPPSRYADEQRSFGREPGPEDGAHRYGGQREETWQRMGPPQGEPVRRPPARDDGGRRYGGPRDGDAWQRGMPMQMEPTHKPGMEDSRRYGGTRRPPQADEEGSWRRGPSGNDK